MEIVNNILLWLHLTALAVGGAAAFGLPIIGSRIPAAAADTRPLLFSISHSISRVAQVAMAVLLVTGPLLVWLKFGGTGGLSGWFWLKMAFVVLLLVTIIIAGQIEKRVEQGNMSLMVWLPRLGMLDILFLLGVILSAVFAFN